MSVANTFTFSLSHTHSRNLTKLNIFHVDPLTHYVNIEGVDVSYVYPLILIEGKGMCTILLYHS